MYPKTSITHTPHIGPWGQTTVHIAFDGLTDRQVIFQGHANVTTNEIGVTCVQRGASMLTTLHFFSRDIVPFRPIPEQRGVRGVLVLFRADNRTTELAAAPTD
jgi:hypothetical protein